MLSPLLSTRTLYRSPVKTLLTFILLGVVTFAFFSQTAEYAITTREFNSAARQYCGVGSAEVASAEDSYAGSPMYINTDPRMPQPYSEEDQEYYLKLRYKPLTQEQIGKISEFPYITSVDTRYMTAGVSDTYDRLDDGSYFYNYTARAVIEGTLSEVKYGNLSAVTDVSRRYNRLILDDCTLLAGNPPWAIDHEKSTIYVDPLTRENSVVGISATFGRTVTMHTSNYVYDTDYVKNMTPGSRYVFVLRFEPLSAKSFYLSDDLSEPWCGAVWPVDDAPDDYLETDRFAPLRELVEITNADAHTFDMVYTDDISAILRFAEGNMTILDGRGLTPGDSAGGASVCVVSREFAEANKLKTGDKITMKLGTELFEQYKGLGAVAAAPGRYTPAEKTAELEIVGIYTDTDGPNKQSGEPNWSYSINTIFVPKTLLPVPADKLAGHTFTPAEFSFKLENAWDIPAFLEETAQRFAEMGLKLVFYDDGWTDIAHGFQATRQLSLIKIAALSAAVAAATGFVVYLFIGRKKKEYAVMRALGATRRVSARALVLPLSVVTGAAVLAGSAAAWVYTLKTIAHNNALSLLKEYAASTTIPAGAAFGCIAGELLLALVFALVLLRRIGAASPLELLQGNGNRQVRKKSRAKPAQNEAQAVSAPPEPPAPYVPFIEKALLSGISEPVRQRRRGGASGFVLRYIRKHLRRSAGKTVLSVLLAVLLIIAVGQLGLMKQSYFELCDDTVITANFVGGLPLVSVPQIMKSSYVKAPYYEVRETVDLNSAETSIVFTNNIARYTGEEADITYADGFDASAMDQFGKTIVAGKALMEMYGLGLGDTVTLAPRGLLEGLQSQYISTYKAAHPNEDIADGEILVLYQDEITRFVNSVTRTYTLAGVVTTPSGKYDRMAFTPGDYEASTVVGKTIKLDVAEFTLTDNLRVDDFRSYGNKTAGGSATDGVAFVMDTSKLENLRNTLRLLETLYPVAMTAALLIGGFLCCLTVLQSSKEAAIMRVLGTTKRKTRTILALEQIILSTAGLVTGAGGLLAYKGQALAGMSAQLTLFAALYFAVILVSAAVCAALAIRRNVLELLQTKE